MEKIKAAFRFLFGTEKGRAISDGFCTVLWVFVAFTAERQLLAGLCAMNAGIFGVSAGMHLARHFELQIRQINQEIINNQDEFIDELVTELRMLREKDAS
jgi:hypothetical protein